MYGIDFTSKAIIYAALALALFIGAVFLGFVLFLNKRLDKEQELMDKLQAEGRLEDLVPDEPRTKAIIWGQEPPKPKAKP
jgi:hypothetical protein